MVIVSNVDYVDHPLDLMMVDIGRYLAAAAALLDETDLVEWREKMERLIPELPMRFLVQRLKVSIGNSYM